MPNFKAGSDSFKGVKDDFCVLENFFEIEHEFVRIKDMALIVVLFINDEQTGDAVENSVYTFIGSGCSGPSFLFFELGMIIRGKEAGSI